MPRNEREVLVIKGRLDRAGRFVPKRCRSTTHVRSWPVVSDSPLIVELLGQNDQVLHREKAEMKADVGCDPGAARKFRVTAYIELRDDALAVRLRNEDVILWKAEIPPPARLSVVGPGKRATRSKPVLVRLQMSEAGEGAHVALVYRWGTRQFRVVYVGAPQERIAVDLSELPGGDACLIAVSYSNGMRSAHAATGEFSLPRLPPEIAIVRPSSGQRITAGTPVCLEASLVDAQRAGGPRPDEDLVWFVGEHEVGKGLLTSVDGLTAGTQVITAAYRADPGGKASIDVRVIRPKIATADEWPGWNPVDGDLTR